MHISKAKLALLVTGTIVLAEMALIGTLAALHVEVPEQAWSLIYATVGILAGVAGAQTLNGHIQKEER